MSLVDALVEDSSLAKRAENNVGIGISLTALVSSFTSPGAVLMLVCVTTSLCSLAFLLVTRHRAPKIAQFTPWVMLGMVYVWSAVMTALFGPTSAMMTIVPIGLVLMFLAVGVLHLNPWRPFAYAAAAAAGNTALWLWAKFGDLPDKAIPGVDPDLVARVREVLLSPMQLVSDLAFFLGAGAAFSFAVVGMRAMLRRAEQVTRQRDLFGKYRLGAPIAAGGMASVVRASYCPDGGFERPVAIKRIHPHLASRRDVVERFRREAEIGARLAHPNIVAVLDFGRVDDTWFIAMEHVDGVDLRRVLRSLRTTRRRMPPALAGLVAHQLLAGLAFAHAGARDASGALLHVVHRDLSPANVLIATTGDVKIVDFGIACALREAEVHHTRHIAGSLGYLSPEQATRAALDHRSDLFAVGVLLWEMLTGRPLWKRETEAMTMLAVMHEEAPLVQWLGLSSAWDSVLRRALAKDPADRFDSAGEMADAIKAVVVAEHRAMAHADELAAFVRTCVVVDVERSDRNDPAPTALVSTAASTNAPTALEVCAA